MGHCSPDYVAVHVREGLNNPLSSRKLNKKPKKQEKKLKTTN